MFNVQYSAIFFSWRTYKIVCPSDPQSGNLFLPGRFVTWTNSPDSTSRVYKFDNSLLPWLNTILRPSGDQEKRLSHTPLPPCRGFIDCCVSCLARPPSTGTIHQGHSPFRADTKAICFVSGEKRGSTSPIVAVESDSVSLIRLPVWTSKVQIVLLFQPSFATQ